MAEAQPAGGKSEKKISSQKLSSNPGVCSQRRCLISEQIFVIENSQESCAFFAVILVSTERYNVNKRITRSIFADYLFSYYLSETLHLYAISAFKISSYYFIKVCFLSPFFLKGFPAYMKNTFTLPSSF